MNVVKECLLYKHVAKNFLDKETTIVIWSLNSVDRAVDWVPIQTPVWLNQACSASNDDISPSYFLATC